MRAAVKRGGVCTPAPTPRPHRLRLRAGVDISGFSAPTWVILTARRELRSVPGSWFEGVDVSGLMVGADSGQVG